MLKYSRETLLKRLEKLEARLYDEKMRLHRMIDNTGWGAGMRCTKCTPSFRLEDELKNKIEIVKSQLRALDADS